MNKYELIKTIGFKLEPIQINELKEQAKQLENLSKDDRRREHLAPFIEKTEVFICHFKKFIFVKNLHKNQNEGQKASGKTDQKDTDRNNRTENKRYLNNIYIKYQWLHSYTKSEFFFWSGGKKGRNKYFIREIPYLKALLEECVEKWEDIIRCLKNDYLDAPEENLERRSQTALLISQFSKSRFFHLLKILFITPV